jgi:hypothetical protein
VFAYLLVSAFTILPYVIWRHRAGRVMAAGSS